jgi:hypothetical protein
VFDDFKPINPRAERWKRRLLIAVPLVAILAGYLYYEFKNYPEEQAVSRFLETVARKDYDEAYRLWQPSSYYKMKDFLQDWGDGGVEGVVKEFDVTGSHAQGSGVIVYVRLNGRRDIALWVERGDKSLSFPP